MQYGKNLSISFGESQRWITVNLTYVMKEKQPYCKDNTALEKFVFLYTNYEFRKVKNEFLISA